MCCPPSGSGGFQGGETSAAPPIDSYQEVQRFNISVDHGARRPAPHKQKEGSPGPARGGAQGLSDAKES